MHVVLIETSGNQRYIFATNKLRENVGASQLTYQVGTKTVLEAIGKGDWVKNDPTGNTLRKKLLDKNENPEVGNGNKIEVIVTTSGKAILLVDERTTGEQVIRGVTQTALKEMPGLTVHGTISSEVKNGLSDIHNAIGEVHRKLENIRHQVPSNEHRFQRLPFFAQCKTSGLPAQTFGKEGSDQILLSTLSATKQRHSEAGRLEAVLQCAQKGIHLTSNPGDLEKKFKELDWVAVVHADGNGLGQIFLDFDRYAGFDESGQNWSGRKYVKEYRRFSVALDICTINAAALALKNMQTAWQENNPSILTIEVPAIPLVLGGDDLTLLCDGAYALKFAHDFLTAFEEQTRIEHDLVGSIVKQISQRAFGRDYLGICAGVAIVKPHFPFHQAYELAESLLRSAKQVKDKMKHLRKGKDGNDEELQFPASAMDFHILYDSTYSDLELIREKLRVDVDGDTHLYAKPYIVSAIDDNRIKFKDDPNQKKARASKTWLKNHAFSELRKRVEAMRETEDADNKRKLPSSQLHGLREALYLGEVETDARAKLIAHRYKEEGFALLFCDKNDAKPSLFFDEEDGKKQSATHFLDALDSIEFWKGFPEPKGKSDSVIRPDNGGKEDE